MIPVTQQILFSLLIALVSAFVGYRFALNRERRKEFNELADRLFLNVDVELKETSAHNFYIIDADIKLIRRRMGRLKRRTFDRALECYHVAASDTYQDRGGQVYYSNPVNVNESLKAIAKCLNRK